MSTPSSTVDARLTEIAISVAVATILKKWGPEAVQAEIDKVLYPVVKFTAGAKNYAIAEGISLANLNCTPGGGSGKGRFVGYYLVEDIKKFTQKEPVKEKPNAHDAAIGWGTQNGVPLSEFHKIKGSGKNGQVLKRDVKRWKESSEEEEEVEPKKDKKPKKPKKVKTPPSSDSESSSDEDD
jgi:hypothetical protein